MIEPSNEFQELVTRIGLHLKYHRNRQKFRQKDLSYLLGVSYQQLQKYESGQNRISAARLYHCSEILGVPIESFFPKNCASVPRAILQEMDDLQRLFCGIKNEKDRQILLDIARSYALR